MKQKNKGQVFVYEIFLVLIVVFIIVFLEINIINNYLKEKEDNKKNLRILEEIFIVNDLVSDCNYLATKKQSTCYKNNISLKEIDYKSNYYFLSRIYIEEKEIYVSENEDVRCYNRGVVFNNSFKVIEVCFYEQ